MDDEFFGALGANVRDVIWPRQHIVRKVERRRLARDQSRVDAALRMARARVAELHVPACWVHRDTYELRTVDPFSNEYLALCVGDSLRYSFLCMPLGRHPLMYIGDGIVVGLVQFKFGRGRINVEKIDTELFSDAAANGAKKPRLMRIVEPLPATNIERLARIERVARTMGIYRYNFFKFNCQHLWSWWVHGGDHVRSACVRRAVWLVPVVLVVFVGIALGFAALIVRKR